MHTSQIYGYFVTKTGKEIFVLVKARLEYVKELEGVKIFKKRKL
jgi:hypothetical protein